VGSINSDKQWQLKATWRLPAPTSMGTLLRITVLPQAGHLNPALRV
jgi:hypothetical protein